MSEMDVKAIRERAEKATPGPWTIHSWGEITSFDVTQRYVAQAIAINAGYEVAKANADFIAHARTDVPALIDEIERLRRELADALQKR